MEVFYPDLEFLLSLHLEGDHTEEAASLLRRLNQPLTINLVHQIQVEGGLTGWLHHADSRQSARAARALRLWREHLREGVFQIVETDFDAGLRLALVWTREAAIQLPPWAALIHVAFASVSAARAFLSFDPRLRRLAKQARLAILPAQL